MYCFIENKYNCNMLYNIPIHAYNCNDYYYYYYNCFELHQVDHLN